MNSLDIHPAISELHQLIRWKQSEKAIKLLKNYQNSNIPINQEINHETALHLASQFDDSTVMSTLLQQFKGSINLNCKDFSGSTPLHIACSKGNSTTVGLLLKYGSNPNAQCDRQKQTPAHYAAESGSISVLRLLKKFLAKMDLQNIFGNTPLHRASYHNHKQAVQFLLEECEANPSIKNFDDQSPLYMAIVHGDYDSVTTLVSKFNADIEAKVSSNFDRSLLQIAIQEKKDIIIQYLINKGANVNNVDAHGSTPLIEAVAEQNIELCKLLIDNGAEVNVFRNIDLASPLHISAQIGNFEIMQLLLQSGATVNNQNQQDKTALHLACASGNSKCVKLLLESKAKRNIKDCNGKTPFELNTSDSIKSLFNEKMRWPSHLNISIPRIGLLKLNDSTPKKEMNLFPESMMRLKKKFEKTTSSSPLASFGGVASKANSSQSDSKESLLITSLSENLAAKSRSNTVAGKIALRKHAEKVQDTINQFENMIEYQQNIDPTVDISYYKDYILKLKEQTSDKNITEGKENKRENSWDPYFVYDKSLSSARARKESAGTKVIRIR